MQFVWIVLVPTAAASLACFIFEGMDLDEYRLHQPESPHPVPCAHLPCLASPGWRGSVLYILRRPTVEHTSHHGHHRDNGFHKTNATFFMGHNIRLEEFGTA